MSDEPGWITKADAATRLGVDERTIERRARAGRITSKARPGFPTRYWATDVENLKQTGAHEVRTGLLEAAPGASSNGNGAVAHRRDSSASVDSLLVQVLHALLGALAPGPTGPTDGPTGPTSQPALFLTVTEASAVSGLPPIDLRRAIESGELKARKTGRGGWRIRRRDLEAL